MLLDALARTSADVAATSARLRKTELIAECLRQSRPAEVPIVVAYLAGELPQGSIGVGWAGLRELPPPAGTPALEALEVDAAVARIASISGKGSQAARRAELADLFGRATEREQRFLRSLLLGELRQGALEGVMLDAVAKAAGRPAAEIRRATMLAGNVGAVAASALGGSDAGLDGFRLTVFRPVKPMLAQTAEDLPSALTRLNPAAIEWKLDGARLQVHRLGDEVRAYTRNLADVTDRVPEVVQTVLGLRAESLVLDGEAIALKPDGTPHRFQLTMSRFGSRNDADKGKSVPLSTFFFDLLHIDGEDVLDRPARERLAILDRLVPPRSRVPRIEAMTHADAESALAEALAKGHEGVMVKALDAPYEAGRRGGSWLKLKPTHTLDLVVLAAEWGHGRRTGKLSNLHLGARDPATGGFVMLGKTFKGMTDAMLAWQTEKLLELEERRDSYVVHVRPELVVEVAFDGVQTSRRYPGGVALRFARVKGYRPDKGPGEADTIDTVRAIHEGSA
ncbi:MAG: ATP-dependent DNA ligase [Actinobacteria bacterium]|nr:ATP-dependent DNA ligase [Actinomycetota bacterium]